MNVEPFNKGVNQSMVPNVLGSKLPLFSYGRDGHQPESTVGVYISIIRILYQRWDEFIPNTRSLDPGLNSNEVCDLPGNRQKLKPIKIRIRFQPEKTPSTRSYFLCIYVYIYIYIHKLGGGFEYFYFHPYLGEDFQFDEHIFQMGYKL